MRVSSSILPTYCHIFDLEALALRDRRQLFHSRPSPSAASHLQLCGKSACWCFTFTSNNCDGKECPVHSLVAVLGGPKFLLQASPASLPMTSWCGQSSSAFLPETSADMLRRALFPALPSLHEVPSVKRMTKLPYSPSQTERFLALIPIKLTSRLPSYRTSNCAFACTA